MQTRSAGAKALNLLLLVSLLLAAGNELLCCDDGPDRHEIVAEAFSPERQIAPTEGEHDDDCLCCGLRSQRVSFAPFKATDPALVVAEATTARRSTFFVERLPASHTNRGPPTC